MLSLRYQGEVVAALQARANVEPSLTHLVWQKLEEQNPDFFNAYDIQLRLKDQILVFNCLVGLSRPLHDCCCCSTCLLTRGAVAALLAALCLPGAGADQPHGGLQRRGGWRDDATDAGHAGADPQPARPRSATQQEQQQQQQHLLVLTTSTTETAVLRDRPGRDHFCAGDLRPPGG